MSFHFFTVPTLDSVSAQDELNAFCETHRMVQVERHFVSDGQGSHWALCVQVAPGPGPLPDSLKRRSTASSAEARVDYKAVLSEAEFTRFAALRSLRKTLAEQEGVPLYAVFTNEQLAAMAKSAPQSAAEVQAVEGVGPARVQRYAQAVLSCLRALDAQAP
jgi:superfamily II DNA helicase RecQ